MGMVPNLADRATKFSQKTAPDRVGSRYETSKTVAVNRYAEATSVRFALQEVVRNILTSKGVPPGLHGVYYGFAFMAMSKAFSHQGETLKKFIAGLKARFTAFGADPAILDEIAKLFIA